MSVSSPESQRLPRRKKIDTACDLCRIKKTRCDGRHPCSRCIFDNSICVFAKKKKPRDNYPPEGYLEMLETRVDLLTRSLLKVVSIAEPHLPFLQQIKEKSGISDSNSTLPEPTEPCVWRPPIPINDIVSYLISDFVLNYGDLNTATENTDVGCDSLNTVSSQNNFAPQKEFNHQNDVQFQELNVMVHGSLEQVNIGGAQHWLESIPASQALGYSPYNGTNSTNQISFQANEVSSAIPGNCINFNFNEPQGEEIFSTFDDSINSSLMETPYVTGKEPQLSLFHINTETISTSPLSISPLCTKLDNDFLETSSNTPILQFPGQSPSWTGDPCHRYNHHGSNFSHALQVSGLTTTVPENKNIFINQDILPLKPSLSTKPVDHGNHLIFNVPSPRLINEALPLFLEEGRCINQPLHSFQ